jgi:hypothetical protein
VVTRISAVVINGAIRDFVKCNKDIMHSIVHILSNDHRIHTTQILQHVREFQV